MWLSKEQDKILLIIIEYSYMILRTGCTSSSSTVLSVAGVVALAAGLAVVVTEHPVKFFVADWQGIV